MNLTFPIALMVMNKWLQTSGYWTNIGIDAFVLALALSIMLMFLAVSKFLI